MKIHEYQAKEIIPVQMEYLYLKVSGRKLQMKVQNVDNDINKPVAIKSQVLVGGRGKAGGIKFADNPEKAYEVTSELLGITN